MRYTRNRQLMKLEGLDKVATKFPNLPITLVRDNHWQLDKSFEWHRDFVWEIEKYWESYITIGTYGQDDFKVISIK
ncbi:hypothetical protein [Pectobacterium phage PcaP2EGY]